MRHKKIILYFIVFLFSIIMTCVPPLVDIVGTPTFNYSSGTYSSALNLTISSTTDGAAIIYTTDGSDPAKNNGTLFSGTVSVDNGATIKAFAYKEGFQNSDIAAASYSFQVADPSINYPAGTIYDSCDVSIDTATTGATIKYTIDGSIPSASNGNTYSVPFTLYSGSYNVKAIAVKSGWFNSNVVDATIDITVSG